jgi:hypothetical protein
VTSSSTAALLRPSLLDGYFYSCAKSTTGRAWSQVEHPTHNFGGAGHGSAHIPRGSADAAVLEVGNRGQQWFDVGGHLLMVPIAIDRSSPGAQR